MTREEALQAIKEKMDYYESDKRLRGAIQTLIPELAESEDERVIKLIRSLLENVRNVQSNTSLYKQYDDALAWLEKQKEEEGYEAIPVESTLEYKLGFKAGKESEKQKDLTTENIYKHSRERMSFYNGQQKEQKPISNPKWAELTWKDINELERIINNVHYEFQNGIGEDSFGELVLERFKEYKDDGSMDEQKPAEWSEEDREAIDMCLDAIPKAWKTKSGILLTKWLRDKLNSCSQPKQEWSEEDERMLSRCVKSIESSKQFADSDTFKEAKDNEICWLENRIKSFDPQFKDEIYKEKNEAFKLGKHQLAIKFMNYLDENRPEGKMGLSNGECEDIDKAFKENDWAKIMRYAEKYLSHWKPSEEQMDALIKTVDILRSYEFFDDAHQIQSLYIALNNL